jgi:hypothetical protein
MPRGDLARHCLLTQDSLLVVRRLVAGAVPLAVAASALVSPRRIHRRGLLALRRLDLQGRPATAELADPEAGWWWWRTTGVGGGRPKRKGCATVEKRKGEARGREEGLGGEGGDRARERREPPWVRRARVRGAVAWRREGREEEWPQERGLRESEP